MCGWSLTLPGASEGRDEIGTDARKSVTSGLPNLMRYSLYPLLMRNLRIHHLVASMKIDL